MKRNIKKYIQLGNKTKNFKKNKKFNFEQSKINGIATKYDLLWKRKKRQFVLTAEKYSILTLSKIVKEKLFKNLNQ